MYAGPGPVVREAHAAPVHLCWSFRKAATEKGNTMPKVILNKTLKGIRGAMEDFVYRTAPNGQVYLSKRPDMSNVEWSDSQRDSRQRFREASKYARAAMAHPELSAIYKARAAREKRVPYRVALSDYLNGKDLPLTLAVTP